MWLDPKPKQMSFKTKLLFVAIVAALVCIGVGVIIVDAPKPVESTCSGNGCTVSYSPVMSVSNTVILQNDNRI